MEIILALLMTVVAAAPAWAQPVRVGFASAMSGPSAITGEGVVWGATMAVEELNARGGIMGRKVEAYFADNKGTPGEAVSAVRKLVDVDKVDVIIGQTHSGACLGAMPIIKELGVAQVTEACSNPKIRELSGKGGNEWQFRVNIDDVIMANTFAKSIAQQVKSASVIAQNDDFGRGAAAAYDAAFKKFGVKLLSTEFFDRGQADYRPLLTKIKRANPDAVLLVMLASDASVFLRQLRELGLKQRLYARGSVATVELGHLLDGRPRSGVGEEVAGAVEDACTRPRQPRRHHVQARGGPGHRAVDQEVRQGGPEDHPRRARGDRREGHAGGPDQVRRVPPGLDQHDPARDEGRPDPDSRKDPDQPRHPPVDTG